MDKITVLIVTFNRPQMIRKTIYGFLKYHNYNLGDLIFHAADNDSEARASAKDYIPSIISEFPYLNWQYTIEKKPGWGNNVNTALKKINTNFIFLIEDDREAYDTINLKDGVTLLQNETDLGVVRYDGIVGHIDTVLTLKECQINKHKIPYCEINQRLSRRPITYSNQPHLRHKRFTEYYGLYPENVKLGKCERLYASHIKRNPDGPKIAILQDGIQNRFHHLGAGKNSRQHSEWDK